MTRVRLVLLAGAVVLAAAIVLVASQSDRRLLGSNRVPLVIYSVRLGAARVSCQPATLPSGTGTLRVPVFTYHRARPALTVTAGPVRLGAAPAGPPTATYVDVPIRAPAHDTVVHRLCVRAAPGGRVALGGAQVKRRYAARAPGGRPLGGLTRFEYETAGPQTWWSALGGIAQRFAYGKAGWVGRWTLVLVAVLALGAIAAAGWTLAGGRGLVAGCALAAALNLVAWSLLTPPFHVPDETAHFDYAQTLAESGRPPVPHHTSIYSAEEATALDRLYFGAVIGRPRNLPPSLASEQRRLSAALDRPLDRLGNGDASVATAQPPLYYALTDVPYAVASSGSILTRLSLMRLVSCLFGVVTVLCCLGFLREALPGEPWAWAVGALAVAFQPMFAFISSGLNPDAMLFAAAAGLFWALAAAFRRGLSPPRGAAIGAALLAGALAKLNFLGLLPGVVVALAYLAWRDRRRETGALWGALTAVALLALPLAVYVVLNVTAWDRPAFGFGGIASLANPNVSHAGGGQTLGGLLSYTWQLYLPRLPGMFHWFTNVPPRDLWFDGLVGRFGWLDYGFAGWVYDVAIAVGAIVLALALAGIARARAALPRRLPELAAYALMAAGLLFVIARAGYQAYTADEPPFEQARYLLPLLALYAALVALAARGGGRRWGPALGALLVMVAVGHDVFAGLITLARYYG